MNRILNLLFTVVVLLPAVGYAAEDLSDFRWEHRIVMVFAESDQLEDPLELFRELEEEVLDRHILWFLVDGTNVATNYENGLAAGFSQRLAERYRNGDQNDFEVVLVGKDGGVKYRSDKLEPEVIFGTIDRMPMRRAEMKD